MKKISNGPKSCCHFSIKNGIDYTAFKNGYDVLNVIVRFSYVNIESFEEYQETLRDLDLDIDDVEYDSVYGYADSDLSKIVMLKTFFEIIKNRIQPKQDAGTEMPEPGA